MFTKLKELRRKLAGAVVTYYYNRLYRKAVAVADKRHSKEGETIYVIENFIRGRVLSCVNRKEFRFIKHSAQKLHRNGAFWKAEYGMEMLRKQAWYHTPDRSGGNGLSARDAEIRRLAFIRSGLKKARLI